LLEFGFKLKTVGGQVGRSRKKKAPKSIQPNIAFRRVIQTVTELNNQGMSLRQIAKFLTQTGVPTRGRGKSWHPEMVNRILTALPRRSEFVFSRDDGQPWSVVSYYRKFARVRAKIAYKKKFDSYAFRHTFAYHFLRKGGAITQLQALLGHRSIDMTVFMYGSIAAKNAEKTTPYDF
jgi:integrase